jgi:signal transduction histidine kinase
MVAKAVALRWCVWMLLRSAALRRWSWALLAPVAVIAVVFASRPLFDRVVFTSLVAAIAFVAWDGGEAPAMLATAVSMALVMLFYLPPFGSLHVRDPADLVALAVFFVVATFTGRTTGRLREAMRRERTARLEADGRRREADELRRHAESSNRAKDEFLAMLSHELRNPLEGIAAAAAVLKRAGRSEEQNARAQQVIARQITHLRTLTSDLLDVARLTTGKIVLSRRPVDLADVARSWCGVLESTGALRRHGLRIDAEPAWVEGDQTRLMQVVENLLSNALKYTPPGGDITVTIAPDRDDAVLRVSDTGIGIEPELLPRVFDLFVQGEQRPDRPTGGLGVGLTLVKRLVEMHGGSVVAASAGPGRGSSFEVRLPRLPTAPVTAPVSTSDRRHATARVLIVEDDADSREMLRVVLELDGYEVHDAPDGLAGLDMARSLEPDIMIVDIGLPGLDGYELARRIRATDFGRRARLIAVSGYGQAEDRRRSLDAGFDVHLVKPVDEVALAQAMRRNAA